MTRLMDMALDRLTKLLLEMGDLSEKTVITAIDAYKKGTNIEEVDRWVKELKRLYDQVSELSIEVIARYQPVASDLRFVKASMEVAYGFFRFGRYSHDIMEVLDMFGDISACSHDDVELVGRKTIEMIKMSVEAFAKKDVQLAREIAPMDDYVDSMYRDHIKEMISHKKVDLKCTLSETLVLRYLERIADHATYIGGHVESIVTGQEPA